jgi:hypothetical protein
MNIFYQSFPDNMSVLQRFIDSSIRQFIPKEYTKEQVIEKLTSEILMLEKQLITHEYNEKVFAEKTQLLRDKREEREKFRELKEENLNQKQIWNSTNN